MTKDRMREGFVRFYDDSKWHLILDDCSTGCAPHKRQLRANIEEWREELDAKPTDVCMRCAKSVNRARREAKKNLDERRAALATPEPTPTPPIPDPPTPPNEGHQVTLPTQAPHKLKEGWVLMTPNALWHFRHPDGVIQCQKTRGPQTHSHEWREAPRGANEVCQFCRKYTHLREVAEAREARAKKNPPATSTESIPQEPIKFYHSTPPSVKAAPSEPQPEHREAAVPTPIQTPAAPAAHTNGANQVLNFCTIMQFSKKHGVPEYTLRLFIKDRLPNLPKFGTGSKAAALLDQSAQTKILAEMPSWNEERRMGSDTAKNTPKKYLPMGNHGDQLNRIEAMLSKLIAELGVDKKPE